VPVPLGLRLQAPIHAERVLRPRPQVKSRGTAAIRRDILVREHRLNERQGRAIEFLLTSPQMNIADFEACALT
jgi:hypothetical protein